jgi:hypothetical protein
MGKHLAGLYMNSRIRLFLQNGRDAARPYRIHLTSDDARESSYP